MNGTSYTDAEELEIVTLENAIYMNMKNDIAFILIDHLNLYEHQSTYNPNMPLRDLFYISREYEKLVDSKLLYTTTPVKLPTPHFVVFYNGMEKLPEQQILKLSDLYQKKEEEAELELRVHMLNINLGCNKKILEQCKLLQEYMLYIQKVRDYAADYPLQDAVHRAVDDCIKEDILKEFLTKFRREAIQMSIFEYDEEAVIRLIRQDEREQGVQQGIQLGMQQGIQQGMQQGMQQGKNEKLYELIQKKLDKNKSIAEIAEELEETVETIQKLLEEKNSITNV